MSASDKTFEWIDFMEGRVRYSGCARGRDAPTIETFAIEFDSIVYYGEIKTLFLPDRYNFNIKVISFGWPSREWPGLLPEPDWCNTFTVSELHIIQKLICQAVQKWRELEYPPSFMTESLNSHFMGDVLFNDGWALIKSEDVTS